SRFRSSGFPPVESVSVFGFRTSDFQPPPFPSFPSVNLPYPYLYGVTVDVTPPFLQWRPKIPKTYKHRNKLPSPPLAPWTLAGPRGRKSSPGRPGANAPPLRRPSQVGRRNPRPVGSPHLRLPVA